MFVLSWFAMKYPEIRMNIAFEMIPSVFSQSSKSSLLWKMGCVK